MAYNRVLELRLKPSGNDKLADAINENVVLIGWSYAEGLLDRDLTRDNFRDALHQAYYPDDSDSVRSGHAAGHLWRFLREYKSGDLIVVPHERGIFFAEISGDAYFDPSKQLDDTAYRRPVKWLNADNPIPRSKLDSATRRAIDALRTTSKDLTEFAPQISRIASKLSITNNHWTASEISAIVEDYFAMLQTEQSGNAYDKTEHRNALMKRIHRNKGSIEFKHQNISAVLDELGLPWIKGYRPRFNYQSALISAIEQHLKRTPFVETATPVDVGHIDFDNVMVEAPTPIKSGPKAKKLVKALAKKIDWAAKDAANRKLGSNGEVFVLAFEQFRLRSFPKLAEKIRCVSQEDGDGLGYDIHSFFEDGSDLFIEVKTTRGGERAPFYISENERVMANALKDNYRIYRVYDFGPAPKLYQLRVPLEDFISLTPTVYRAAIK